MEQDAQTRREAARAARLYWEQQEAEAEAELGGQQAEPVPQSPAQQYAVPTQPFADPRSMAEKFRADAVASGATEETAQARVLAAFAHAASQGDRRFVVEDTQVSVFASGGIPMAEEK